jgi:hypothetical protein
LGCLQLVEKAEGLLVNHLALKLCDELSKGFEFFALASHHLDELFALKNQT